MAQSTLDLMIEHARAATARIRAEDEYAAIQKQLRDAGTAVEAARAKEKTARFAYENALAADARRTEG